jgi:hypothetical protein
MKKIRLILAVLLIAALFVSCAPDGSKEALSENKNTKEQISTIEGIYQGLSDNNSYEVKLSENTYKILTITEDIRAEFEKLNLKKGDKIEATYKKGPASKLETISIRLAGSEPKETVTGKYIGLADNNFFEVLIDSPVKEEYRMFMITETGPAEKRTGEH